MGLTGIWGHPFLDLEPLLDLRALPGLHDEICLGLAQVDTAYTGGSHRSLGIVPPSLPDAEYADYGEALRALTPEQFAAFTALAECPGQPEPADAAAADREDIGEDKGTPLSFRQMLYLKYRAGVYFPWKVYYELLPNRWWHEKSAGAGKAFTAEARALFPRTVAFVESLPFRELGWVKILGLHANDHGTVHLDGDPATKLTVDNFITFCPAGNKRLYLWDEERRERLHAPSRVYWFNDSDHGIEPDPYFRYSIRVDGIFTDEFMEQLIDRYGGFGPGGG
jgi:hypothetical protein